VNQKKVSQQVLTRQMSFSHFSSSHWLPYDAKIRAERGEVWCWGEEKGRASGRTGQGKKQFSPFETAESGNRNQKKGETAKHDCSVWKREGRKKAISRIRPSAGNTLHSRREARYIGGPGGLRLFHNG